MQVNTTVTKRLTILAAAFAATVTAIPLWAARPLPDTPLLVWFGNETGDGLKSDGQHVVVNSGGALVTADYANGIDNVLAVLQNDLGLSRFDMQSEKSKPSIRNVCVDFGTQLDAVTVRPLPLSVECVNIEEPMHNYPANDVAMQKLTLNQQVEKLTRFCWNEAGYRWRIGYGTDMNQDGTLDSPPVVVTCIATGGAGQPCTKWLMTPKTTTLPAGRAAFYRFALLKGGKEGPAEFVADVDMPFSITLAAR
jgi:hypothetical protein